MKIIWLLLPFLLLVGCHKKDPSPEEKLPAATQSGANTFGCLVNGQAWTPKGNNGTSNYSVVYDSGVRGGQLDIQAYRYPDSSNQPQGIAVISDNVTRVGTYSLNNPRTALTSFEDFKVGCRWSNNDSTTTYRRGALVITRLDLQAGIVSGTFWFTLYKPGCDSLSVTQGRFDKKL